MPNPQLTKEQRAKADELLARVRVELQALAAGDPAMLFAYRRRVAKMLTYDERSGPNERRRLKAAKRVEQGGVCATCPKLLPPTHNVLDRLTAVAGYTAANTRLICPECDQRIQAERGYQ